MAKIAQLHDGTEIHFPDTTPDDEMDAAVRRHMDMPDPAVIASFTKVLSSHAKALVDVKHANEGAHAIANKQAQQASRQKEVEHKTHIIAQAAKVESTRDVARALQEGLTSLLGPISGMADASEEGLPQLVMAIDNLSVTISDVGKAVIAAMKLDKEIVPDAKGKPKTLRVKGS